MSTERRVEITGIGKGAGSLTVTRSESAARLVDAQDPNARPIPAAVYERLMRKAGIDERHWCSEEEAASDMATISIPQALEMAKRDIKDVKSIFFATGLPDYLGVPTGTIVAKSLGANSKIATADISGACPGFLHALRYGFNELSGCYGLGAPVIVVASEPASKGVDPRHPETFILFGDASGAVVLDLVEVDSTCLLAEFDYLIDPEFLQDLLVPAGGSKRAVDEQALKEGLNWIKMNGSKVKEKAEDMMCIVAESVLKKAARTFDDIDWFFFHQANIEIINAVGKKLGILQEKVFINIQKYGNTSAASIPVVAREAWEQDKLHRGDNVLAISFGAGFNAAAAFLPMNGLPENPNSQQ